MSTNPKSAIARLVDHHGGATKLAALMGEGFAYQAVQRWVGRGWASPGHFLRLEPLLPEGMTIRDLYADRDAVTESKPAAPVEV